MQGTSFHNRWIALPGGAQSAVIGDSEGFNREKGEEPREGREGGGTGFQPVGKRKNILVATQQDLIEWQELQQGQEGRRD
jgi:hypothetical protein